MEKKTLLTAALISWLLLSTIAGTYFDKEVKANFFAIGSADPPVKPTIEILNPLGNNTLQKSKNLTLVFNASLELDIGSTWMMYVEYKTSWQKDNSTNQQWIDLEPTAGTSSELSYSLSLTGIPEGNQSVFIFAFGRGQFIDGIVLRSFYARAFHSIGFTIDTIPPNISVLDLESNTYEEPQVPLIFAANESLSNVSYVLDGQDNVTVAGNTTLTGLSDGAHNVTVYATDNAGNTGASETIAFSVTVPKPFPTELVTVAGASVGFISVGLAVYGVKIKKRNGKSMKRTVLVAGLFCRKNSIKGGEA
jgi:hypothetical protein